MEQARRSGPIREWLPFACGALLLIGTGVASRLPLIDWSVPWWVAAPLLFGGLVASACLMTGQNVIEGGVIALIAGVCLTAIIVTDVKKSGVDPIVPVQKFAFYGSACMGVLWVVVLVIVFGGAAVRRRRQLVGRRCGCPASAWLPHGYAPPKPGGAGWPTRSPRWAALRPAGL